MTLHLMSLQATYNDGLDAWDVVYNFEDEKTIIVVIGRWSSRTNPESRVGDAVKIANGDTWGDALSGPFSWRREVTSK